MGFIKSEIKNIVVFVAILGGLYFAYTFFFKDNSAAITTIGPSGAGGEIGGDILPTLLEIKDIRLDQSIFADPVFKSLQSFSVELPKEESGRPNPFSSVGQVSANVVNTPTNGANNTFAPINIRTLPTR